MTNAEDKNLEKKELEDTNLIPPELLPDGGKGVEKMPMGNDETTKKLPIEVIKKAQKELQVLKDESQNNEVDPTVKFSLEDKLLLVQMEEQRPK